MPIEITDPEVPRSLPYARLYLDDIEQILRIFLQVQSKATNAGTETRDTPTSTFQVRNRRTTEIEQLPKITKTTNSFTL